MYEYVQDAISICNEENNDYDKLLSNKKNQLRIILNKNI